jgi:hypothetical protein
MMKNTGDSSNQLSMLNEQLGQKNRLVVASMFVFSHTHHTVYINYIELSICIALYLEVPNLLFYFSN